MLDGLDCESRSDDQLGSYEVVHSGASRRFHLTFSLYVTATTLAMVTASLAFIGKGTNER